MEENNNNRKSENNNNEYVVFSIDEKTGEIVQNSYTSSSFEDYIEDKKTAENIKSDEYNGINNDKDGLSVDSKETLTEQDKKEIESEMIRKKVRSNTCKIVDFRSVASVQEINKRLQERQLLQVDRFTLERLAIKAVLKICFNEETNSYMCINKRKIYHYRIDSNSIPSAAIRLMPGFSIELGTQLYNLKEALKMCKLPIGIVEVGSFNNLCMYSIQLQDFTSEKAIKINIATLTVNTNNDKITAIEINDVNDDIIGTYRLFGIFRVAISKIPKERTRRLQIENAMRAIATEKVEILQVFDKPNIIEFAYKTGGSKLTYKGSFVSVGNGMFRLKHICIIQ